MSYKEILEKIKPELDKAVDFLKRELAKVRTSRPSPAIVEDIMIDCFGQKFPLKQLATISIEKGRQILIQPWDKSYIESIVRTLEKVKRGFNISVQNNTIRISLPPLTQEYREELIKLVSQKKEDATKTIRRWRDEAWSKIQRLQREGIISEDEKFKAKKELQKIIDEYNEEIKNLVEKKKKEIME